MGLWSKLWGKSEAEEFKENANMAKVHNARLQELEHTGNEVTSALNDIKKSHDCTRERLQHMDEMMGKLDRMINAAQSRGSEGAGADRSQSAGNSAEAGNGAGTGGSVRRHSSTRLSADAFSLLDLLPPKGQSSAGVGTSTDAGGKVGTGAGTLADAGVTGGVGMLRSGRADKVVLSAEDRAILTSHQDYRSAESHERAARAGIEDMAAKYRFDPLEVLTVGDETSQEELLQLQLDYARRHQVNLNASLSSLLPPAAVTELKQQLEDQYTYKKAQCDNYDYMIAATCGLLGGLIDIFCVGSPTTGILTQWSDDAVDGAICGFARLCGWNGHSRSADETASAIGFLERMFPVNYDQRFGSETGGIVDLRPADHHLKSLGHSPDLLGLFFSILDQFTSQSHFIADGGIVAVDTETYELRGSTLLGKLFCGTANWIGHIMSDVGGSSGSKLRGTGVPIPFFNLFQLADFGAIGADQKTIAQISTQVFAKGYDLRHGLAMAVPVLFTELTIRLMYVLKALFVEHPYPKTSTSPLRFNQDEGTDTTVPTTPGVNSSIWSRLEISRGISSSPELNRMLFVGHGILCLMDAGDALICGKGNLVDTLVRFNLIAWVRFSFLVISELKTMILSGHIDEKKLDHDIAIEYQQMIQALPASGRC